MNKKRYKQGYGQISSAIKLAQKVGFLYPVGQRPDGAMRVSLHSCINLLIITSRPRYLRRIVGSEEIINLSGNALRPDGRAYDPKDL